MPSRRLARVLLLAAAAALAAGCTQKVVYKGRRLPRDVAREQCRGDFRACAPRPMFDVRRSPETLPPVQLVQLASRLDVDDELAEAAAERVRVLIREHDLEVVRELVAAEQIAAVAFGQCRCEPFPSELERQGLADALRDAGRAEQYDPALWALRVVERIEAVRLLVRRSAELAVAGLSDVQARTDAQRGEAERALCETVQLARSAVGAAAFPRVLDLSVRKVVQAGGDEEFTRRTLERHAAAHSCG